MRITKIDAKKELYTDKKIRVAAYARVSTSEEDQLISLEAQKAYYEDYIKSNPEWIFAGLYFDEGITATKVRGRFGLIDMLEDCKDKKIDLVITKSISRFARNTVECLEMIRSLSSIGVAVYFEKENINTLSMESELLLSILSSYAEDESRSISENNKWSIRKRFENGEYKISTPPYGYDVVDGKQVINEEEGNVVKEIYKMYLSGNGLYTIEKHLVKNNIKTKRGGKWSSTTIKAILSNEKYTGDSLFQKTYTDEGYKRNRNNGELQKYLVKNNHEPLVSHEDFNKVKKLLYQNAKEKGNGKNTSKYQQRYTFSGKLICGKCGSKLIRRHHYSTYKNYIAWTCKKHLIEKDKCDLRYILDSDIKYVFMKMLIKLAFSKDIILKALLSDLEKIDDKDLLLKINEINNKLEKLTERKLTLSSIFSSGLIEPSLYAKENNEIAFEEKTLILEKEKLTSGVRLDKKKIESLEELIKLLEKEENFEEFNGEVFEKIVEKIEVKSRNAFIIYLNCGLVLEEVLYE